MNSRAQTIELTVAHFDVESHSACAYDVMRIYAVDFNYNPPQCNAIRPANPPPAGSLCMSSIDLLVAFLAEKCGIIPAGTVYKWMTRRLIVQFCTDSSIERAGYNITWRTFNTQKITTTVRPVDASGGTIASDNYPSNYAPNTARRWAVVVKSGQVRL
ncbi:unnamed protein product [Sphagnum balticum]